jgi:glycosyltransferase involved in cell wall biosynthesis
VFPTHYEGFGMPLLEAMACGCPAIVADTPALVEVGVDCVRRYRPGDVEALAVQLALVHAVEISELRSSVASARDRAARFTWLQAAGRTADVYRSVELGVE